MGCEDGRYFFRNYWAFGRFGTRFIIGPVIGGVLGHYGARVPFYAAAVLCLINFLYGYFILPESLDKDHRRPFDWKRANPIGSLKFLGKHPEISTMVISLILIYIAGHAVQSNWNYFTMYQFNWDVKMVGISLGIIGLLVGLVQGLLIRWINPKIGNERSIY